MLALGFVGLGVWAGRKLTPVPAREGFARNEAAVRSVGLSPRGCEVLELLASGRSNREMARALSISPNTVKTHIARVYEKLEVERRVQAIEKARFLALSEDRGTEAGDCARIHDPEDNPIELWEPPAGA